MEELTSGRPDDWLDSGDISPSTPSSRDRPAAVLDLTDDVRSPSSGPAAAEDPHPARDLAQPVPSGRPRIRFITFVVQDADRLLGTAYLLTGDPGRAEELLRGALAAAGATWSRSRNEPAADVLRAMVRRCLGPVWWWGRPLDAASLPGEVGSGLALLESRQRVALILRYHQRLTEEESAVALGAPVGNVRGWLSRALDRLGIDTRLDLRPGAGPGLSRAGLTAELEALTVPVTSPPIAAPEPTGDHRDAVRLDARLTHVRSRLPAYRRRERRRRTGIRIGIAAASVAVIVAGLALAGPVADPIVDDEPVDDAFIELVPLMPVRPKNPNPFEFQAGLAGDPLLASTVGRAGQDEVVLRFTPHTTNLAFSAFCRTPGAAGPWLTSTLNGHTLTREPCRPDSAANAKTVSRDDYPRIAGVGWADLGVRPGRQSVLLLRLTTARGKSWPSPTPASVRPGRPLPPDVGPARIGIAVYELTGARVVSDGAVLKGREDHEGRSYVLSGFQTMKIGPTSRTLSLLVPSGIAPALVLAAMPDTMSKSVDPMPVSLDARSAPAGPATGTYTFLVPVDLPRLISIRARPDDTGAMVLAWYAPTGS